MKINIEFQEKPVIDAASKYVLENLKRIGEPGFATEIAKVCMEEVKKTLEISLGGSPKIYRIGE